MKKFILIALFALLPLIGSAQEFGVHRIGTALTRGQGVQANVIPFVSVRVCVSGTSCSELAPIFSDLALTIPLQQPVVGDASGNYNYYFAAGCVDEQFSSPGMGVITTPAVCMGGDGVTSLGMTVPSWLSVPNSPLTGSGILNVIPATGQTPGKVIGTCGTATTFAPCSLVPSDIPTLNQNTTGSAGSVPYSGLTGTVPFVQLSPSANQTVVQPTNTNLNVATSGTGSLQSNGSPVLTTVTGTLSGTTMPLGTGVLFNPTVSQTITQPSGTRLNVNLLCPGTGPIDVRACFGAKADVSASPRSCTLSVGSTTLVCTAVTFLPTDVGKDMYIAGAGAAGVSLVTKITGFTSASTVTIGNPAITATSNPNLFYGTDDTAAIQAAYNAAVAAGRALYIPGGDYLHHGLNFTNSTMKIYGDNYGSTFLIAMAVTNPGGASGRTPTGIDLSATSNSVFSGIAVFGGWFGFADLAPTVNFLAARTGPPGTNGFAIEHSFNNDTFIQLGGFSNVYLYGYEQTSFIDCHFEDTSTVVSGDVTLSAVNVQNYNSPYQNFATVPVSMTKVSFNGAKTVFSGNGSQIVLDNGTTESDYSISIRDAFGSMASAGSAFLFASGTGAIRAIEMSNVYLEGCTGCRLIVANGPAWVWNVTTSQFYASAGLTTSPLIFTGGIGDSNIQVDFTGQAVGFSNPGLSVGGQSCSGTTLHLGQTAPSTDCTDYAMYANTGGATFNANVGNAYKAQGTSGATKTCTVLPTVVNGIITGC